jgi:hypothetical protein
LKPDLGLGLSVGLTTGSCHYRHWVDLVEGYRNHSLLLEVNIGSFG